MLVRFILHLVFLMKTITYNDIEIYSEEIYPIVFNFFSIVFINSGILNEANASGGRLTNTLTIALIFQMFWPK